MKKLYFKRLIRDSVLNKLQDKSLEYKIRKLNRKEFLKELKDKLSEEAEGVINSKTKKEMTEELVDLQVVIDEVKKQYKISEADFKKIMKENLARKGGFKKQIYLDWTSDDGYKTNEKKR